MVLKNHFKIAYDIGYRTFTYATGLCSIAGVSNAIRESIRGYDFNEAFARAYINHSKLSILTGLSFPIIFNILQKSDHLRLYGNLYQGLLMMMFLALHHHEGTQNPELAVLPVATTAFFMINRHISEIKNLEQRIGK